MNIELNSSRLPHTPPVPPPAAPPAAPTSAPVWGLPTDNATGGGRWPACPATGSGLVPPALANAGRIDPPMLRCPLSRQLLVHPVLADDGHTYERDWLNSDLFYRQGCSPTTRLRLTNLDPFPNPAIQAAVAALRSWRQEGAGASLSAYLCPATTDPGGSHNPMDLPMTMSEGTTCNYGELAALFQQNPLASPYLSGKPWARYCEQPRYNRALQALSAAVHGFVPPPYPARQSYATWNEPELRVPAPSTRQPHRSFCTYPGVTCTYQPLAVCAAVAVACPLGIVSSLPAGASVGIGAGTCALGNLLLRGIDYPAYRQENAEAAVLYEEDRRSAYETYNAQRAQLGMAPVQQQMRP